MAMSRQGKDLYEFGPFRIDVAERLLSREGQNVPLTPKAFDTLLLLVENQGHLLEKDELMQKLWPNTFVEEANLTNNISLLRKALGDDALEHRYIETVPKRGYRFGASVRECTDESELVVERRTRASLTIEEESDLRDPDVLDADGPRVTTPTKETTAVIDRKTLRRTATWIIAAIVVAAGSWLYRILSPIKPDDPPPRPFQNIKLTKLTGTGEVTNATISPDGKYVVYAMNDAGGQSLWLRQVSTPSNIRIVPPVKGINWGLTFSPDGEYIYVVTFEGNRGDPTLYKIPVLGGVAYKLPNAPDSAITFSPDGSRFAYVHASSTAGRSVLLTANADGSDVRTIAERTQPDFFRPYPFAPAWSPDGKVILCAARSRKNDYGVRLVSVRVEDGSETTLSDHPWNYIRRLAWLSDRSGVVMTAQAESSGYSQIWLVDYPGGDARAITNDFSEYSSLGLTAGSDQLVALQTTARFGLWVSPNNNVENQRQIASESGELANFSWTVDNRVVYRSIASGVPCAWAINADGEGARQLAMEVLGEKGLSVSRDGNRIVFASNRAGRFNIWRMDMDGANLKPLTDGIGEAYPQCSPDGRWVVYQSGVGNVASTLWRVSIDGGEPEQLTGTHSIAPTISRDGA